MDHYFEIGDIVQSPAGWLGVVTGMITDDRKVYLTPWESDGKERMYRFDQIEQRWRKQTTPTTNE